MSDKKVVAFDATLLSSLQACPRMTDFRFNRNLVSLEGKSNSLECGSLVHIILEYFNKATIAGKSRVAAIEEGFIAGKEYRNGYLPSNLFVKDENEKGMVNTPDDSDSRNLGYNFVLQTMEEYFDYWKNDSFTTVTAEEVRGEVIYEDESLIVLWKAKFDSIVDTPQGFISKDYKTMKQRRDTISLNNQFMGQAVLLKARNVMVDKIGFQKSLKVEEKFSRVLVSYSMDRLLEWKNTVVPHYAHMLLAYSEADHFPPNFTHCENKYGYCTFKEVCEYDRNMRDEVLARNFKPGKVWDVLND